MNLCESFLQLVGLGIEKSKGVSLSKDVDWTQLKKLADKQGLSAIVLDGIDKLPADNRPSQVLLLEWIGEVLQNYEQRYAAYEKTIGSLAGCYNEHGYKMMVLKGYACSLDWPKQIHRPCGDIDIWLFGKQKEADEAISRKRGIKIDTREQHHTIFHWGGFMVENHYDFVNVFAHKSSRELETIFKKLGQDDSYRIEINGEKVYLPTPNLHALFLICHMATHFASSEITLRHVLDWAFFVQKHGKDVDWKWLEGLLEKYHMKDFTNSINGICVENLGFHSSIFFQLHFNSVLKDRVLKDILSPEFSGKEPSNVFNRVVFKYRR